jgi:hypothetical protein
LTGASTLSAHNAVLLRHGLQFPAWIIAKFHYTVFQRPIPTLAENSDINSIWGIIYPACETEEIATMITLSIVRHLQACKEVRLTALRATPVYMFNNDEDSWPVVEWTQSDGISRLACFHFNDLDGPEDVSWVMHSGSSPSGASKWLNSCIDCNVADIEDLKTLFGIALHMLVVLEWPVEEAIKLYCEANTDNDSVEEYVSWITEADVKIDKTRQARLQPYISTS